jgi:hypothetical protein
MKTKVQSLLIVLTCLAGVHQMFAQGTAFTYQGKLNTSNTPANGNYDLAFTLYNTSSGGTIAGPFTNSATTVSNGLFTTTIDFSAQVFNGSAVWLGIAVRTNGNGAFFALMPYQQVTPTPYAVFALNAASATTANTATNVTGVLTSSQLPAGAVLGTTNSSGPYLNLASVIGGSLGGLTNLDLTESPGANANHIRFNDIVGSEQIWLHAVKNMDVETLNDVTFFAGHDVTTTVDNDDTHHVKHDATLTVDSNLTETVHASRSISIDVNDSTQVGGSMSLMANNLALSVGNSVSATVANNINVSAGGNLGIIAPGGMGIGTTTPEAGLHIYSTANPTVVRIQSTGEPGFGRIEFVSNPQTDANQWRPAYIQSLDEGGFTGGLAFFDNGTGVANKFGGNEVMRIVNGNVGIGNIAPGNLLVVGGSGSPAYCNGTTWVNGSDRNSKEAFAAINPRTVLEKVSSLPITEWKYKTEAGGTEHLGPMAQDFHAAFGLNGADDKHIATVDEEGVALAAIQGLNQKLNDKDTEVQTLKLQNKSLAERLNEIEAVVKSITEKK